MRRIKAGPRVEQPRGDMNVTPLVDVCLVLLIISMVVVPLLAKVKPPKTEDPMKLSKESKKIHLELRQDGTTWLGSEGAEPHWLVESELEASLREAYERNPGAQVLLAADAELSTGDVRPVLATVRKAGFATLFLISQKEGAQPRSSAELPSAKWQSDSSPSARAPRIASTTSSPASARHP
ncbi:MAG: biopolymer transporter ExbD [Acidobacteria bacterium]|nr:biopolymer transporter ExbD [Acidobacteriota bacterium]